MTNSDLGRLSTVPLRDIWPGEATAFTPWLAREDNIGLLGDIIGIELDVEGQEREVGPFRADILCRDTATGHWVLIENQLERTDHTHLGQLLTYAAGLHAVTIVWVAARFTEEHRAAIDWLNEITDSAFNFFGLEIQLWRIGNSPVAPRFNVVCRPNDWSRAVQERASGELSEGRQLQLDYWTAFRDYMAEQSAIRVGKPQPQHWIDYGIGRTGFNLSTIVSTRNTGAGAEAGELRVEFVIKDSQAKDYYAQMEDQRESLEAAIGETLAWHNPDNRLACRVYVRRAIDLAARHQWAEYHEWMRERLERFDTVFRPLVRELRVSDSTPRDELDD